jgi:hypothetical protein
MLSLGLPALHVAPFFLYSNVYQVGEAEVFEEQEQYFEVPHWMHLSFTSYESDQTVFSKDTINETKLDNTSLNDELNGIEIKANGFVLPRVGGTGTRFDPPSPLLHPSSLINSGTIGNSFAEQTVEFSTQRQLIEGRDFRDILEACRPRHAGLMPTPLRALLEIYSTRIDNHPDPAFRFCEANEVVDIVREEWGSCHFKEGTDASLLPYKRTSRFPDLNSPRANNRSLSPGRDRPLLIDAFLSSSTGTQNTGHLIGIDSMNISNSGGVQLQMPGFLDYHMIEDEYGGIDASRSDEYSSDDDLVASDFAERFRRMMESHDRVIPSFAPLKIDSTTETKAADVVNTFHEISQRMGSTAQPSEQPQRIFRGSACQQAPLKGNLGAALVHHKQYSGTRGFSFVERGNTDSTPKIINGRSSLAFRSNSELEARGLSPLFLPPVISQQQLDTPDMRGQDYSDPSQRSVTMIAPRSIRRVVNMKNPRVLKTSQKKDLWNHELNVSLNRSETTAATEQDNNWQGVANTNPPRKNRNKMRKKVFNPFRQQDEEEVLEKKSHNRRRWSQ